MSDDQSFYPQLQFDDDCYGDDGPNDFAGWELIWLLRTARSRKRAGKSYRPDPQGLRNAIKVSDCKLGEIFQANPYAVDSLEDFYEYLQEWSTDQSAFIVRGHFTNFWGVPRKRHKITNRMGYVVYRRSVKTQGSDGYFDEYPRKLLMLDLDGMPLAEGLSVTQDPENCVKWAVDHLLPPEFRNASFIYQLSSSAALTKLDNELNAHLWFITDQSYDNNELRAWAGWWNAKQERKILDPALYTAVQPHYINDPELLDGLVDPLAGRRLGLIYRAHRTVDLYMPTGEDVTAELGSRQKRAISQFKRIKARKDQRYTSTDEDIIEPELEPKSYLELQQIEPEDHIEDEIPSGDVYFDAVRIGPGWQGYLNAVGFEGHIRAQLLAAVGSYFSEHGSRADRDVLRTAIGRAIEESRFLECGEPWARTRADAQGYLASPPGGKSNVDELISDIGMRQLEKERLANEPWDTEWTLPTLTGAEAFEQIDAAVHQVVVDAGIRRHRLLYGNDIEIHFQDPVRAAVNCSPGTGKTEAVVRAVAILVTMDPAARVVIAVPTHKLGEGLAGRINGIFGAEVAREWYGTDHPDPELPEATMCRVAESAREVIGVGGKLQLLCSRRIDGQTLYCQHHPKSGGADVCGYQRQQASEVTNNTRVWIIPATMLASGPPPALWRMPRRPAGDFDLLVIDEAPWFGLLKDPSQLSIETFSRRPWEADQAGLSDDQKNTMLSVLEKIHDVLKRQPVGEVPINAFEAAGITQLDLTGARRSVWRFKMDLRELVFPGMSRSRLKKALAAVVARNQRVMGVAEALHCISLSMAGNLAPSGMVLGEKDGHRDLYLRRRKDINAAWLEAPTLYLDAADLGSFQIAKAWLPNLDLKVDARASAPHMTVVQLVDSEMSYSKLAPRGDVSETVRNNQEKVAKVIRNLGPHGLVIAPKQLCLAWEEAEALPLGWIVWNFGAIRGRNEANAVPWLVVVSRPMPPVGEVEVMAETIFGQHVNRLPSGTPYPKTPVGRLMAGGQGVRALASRHPDPLVEAVRFAICEGELLQAVGRGRGVQRTAATPLEVLLLTNVPIPVPIERLVAWKDLLDDTGPLRELFTKGVVPLDYAGMAIALGGRFDGAAKLKDWFQYRPEAASALKALRRWAKDPNGFDPSEFSENSYNKYLIEVFAKLAPYRYRRADSGRQSNTVIVDGAMHADARAAVESVLGALADFRAVEDVRRQRTRHHLSAQADLEAILGELARSASS